VGRRADTSRFQLGAAHSAQDARGPRAPGCAPPLESPGDRLGAQGGGAASQIGTGPADGPRPKAPVIRYERGAIGEPIHPEVQEARPLGARGKGYLSESLTPPESIRLSVLIKAKTCVARLAHHAPYGGGSKMSRQKLRPRVDTPGNQVAYNLARRRVIVAVIDPFRPR